MGSIAKHIVADWTWYTLAPLAMIRMKNITDNKKSHSFSRMAFHIDLPV
jgi:hypothetical protein